MPTTTCKNVSLNSKQNNRRHTRDRFTIMFSTVGTKIASITHKTSLFSSLLANERRLFHVIRCMPCETTTATSVHQSQKCYGKRNIYNKRRNVIESKNALIVGIHPLSGKELYILIFCVVWMTIFCQILCECDTKTN